MMFDLKGKVAIVTGGAKGIGFAIAKELLRNNVKGVALVDTDFENGKVAEQELKKEFSDNSVVYLNADVSQRAQFEEAFEQTIQKFNQLDIIVNNAGIVQEIQWEKCISVNLQGCITGSLLALDKYFLKTLGSSEGLIINIASVHGIAPFQYLPVYTATKHGIVGFSRSISNPARCHGLKVKVLVICPAATTTSILNTTCEQLCEEYRQANFASRKDLSRQTPEQLAKHTMSLIRDAESGSVWAITDNSRQEIEFPSVYTLH